jgi:hypothetical protein
MNVDDPRNVRREPPKLTTTNALRRLEAELRRTGLWDTPNAEAMDVLWEAVLTGKDNR